MNLAVLLFLICLKPKVLVFCKKLARTRYTRLFGVKTLIQIDTHAFQQNSQRIHWRQLFRKTWPLRQAEEGRVTWIAIKYSHTNPHSPFSRKSMQLTELYSIKRIHTVFRLGMSCIIIVVQYNKWSTDFVLQFVLLPHVLGTSDLTAFRSSLLSNLRSVLNPN